MLKELVPKMKKSLKKETIAWITKNRTPSNLERNQCWNPKQKPIKPQQKFNLNSNQKLKKSLLRI
jgi:hypothetical protein